MSSVSDTEQGQGDHVDRREEEDEKTKSMIGLSEVFRCEVTAEMSLKDLKTPEPLPPFPRMQLTLKQIWPLSGPDLACV